MIGPRLVIPGTLISGCALALFLFLITAGMTIPATAISSLSLSSSQSEAALVESLNLTASQVNQASSNLETAASVGCQISASFPQKIQQWCELISSYASQHNLPPDLVASVIWQESGGNPSAYSKSGAVGLMQVMPKDGKAANFMCVNGPCFSNRPSTSELNDPEFNIAYGTKMLAELYQHSGSFRDALMAYGPMNVGYYYADKVLKIYENYKSQP